MGSQTSPLKLCPSCKEPQEHAFFITTLAQHDDEVADCVGCRVFKGVLGDSILKESGIEVGYADNSSLDERLQTRWDKKLNKWITNARPNPQHAAQGKRDTSRHC